MSGLDHFRLMASYNAWMNTKVYDTAERLTADELSRDRGAFFGSILGTLNHLAAADLIWLGRLAEHAPFVGRIDLTGLPQPGSIRLTIADDLSKLRPVRERIDRLIVSFIDGLTEADLVGVLEYRRTDGTPHRKLLASVLLHVFNHQTHHRGQVTTLLTQAGIDVGVTDLLALLPDVD